MDIEKLRRLEREIQELRSRLGISKPGEVLFLCERDGFSDRAVIVEADGYGGATLLEVEGNFPIDYIVHSDQSFASESDACEAAEALSGG